MHWLIQAVAAGLIAAGAWWMSLQWTVAAVAERVTVRKAPGAMVEMPKLDNPDYYVVVTLRDGSTLTLPTQEDRPLGNGLVWPLSAGGAAVAVDAIDELQLWDDNLISDEMLDRVMVRGTPPWSGVWELKGQGYTFELAGPPRMGRVGWLAGAGVAAAWGVVCLLLFARWQAVKPRATQASADTSS